MQYQAIIKSAITLTAIAVTLGNLQAETDCPIVDVLAGGTPKVDMRLRYEDAKLDGSDSASAFTLRTRVGYETIKWHGLQLYVEFEDVTALNDSDDYNQAGLNSAASNKTVIADVEGTEVNQAYLSATCDKSKTTIKGGIQKIILDNARFIGNVGWRQNEQTYEGITVKNSFFEDLNVLYGYISGVNRIFGQENGNTPDGEAGNAAAFDSEAHLVNVSYKLCNNATATAYGYLLDLGDETTAAALSSDTYGIRLATSYKAECGLKSDMELEYASQSDNSATTDGVDYTASYIKADILETISHFSLGAGYELLGSDNGASFKTPLATGHKFNGWADMFLVTPATGLEDIYAHAKIKCPKGHLLEVYYHVFSSDEGGIDYGDELDIVLAKKLSDNLKLVAKYASYSASSDANNPKPADMDRISVQMDMVF